MFSDHDSTRTLFGHRVQQTWLSIGIIEKMLSGYQPDCIVELGTGSGSLACYFSVYCLMAKARLVTVDRIQPKAEAAAALLRGRMKFLQANIGADSTKKGVVALLNKSERPFLLVDGADPKYRDLNAYAALLKKGVVIFAHDVILAGKPTFSCGFLESAVDWKLVRKLEPYYGYAKEYDTRMLCLERI